MSFLKSAGIWYDTSPKASEIIAAVFYAITNNVEAAKCYTFISICKKRLTDIINKPTTAVITVFLIEPPEK